MYRLRVSVFASEEMQQSNERSFERVGEHCIINFSIYKL